MQIQSLAERLATLGLSEKQSKVYVANLFLGPVSAQKIAEQAGINRPTAYDILEDLANLGLISRSNDGSKTIFIASGTTALKELLDKQQHELTRRQQTLDELLPELQKIERIESEDSPVVRFVHGKEGVDAIWAHVIRKAKPGTEIFSMTNHDETLKVYPDHLKTNPVRRLNKKISSKQFYYNSNKAVPSDPALLKETVRLPYPLEADLTLYEDSAVLLSYGKTKKGWTGIIIENKDIVGVLRQLFNIAWNNRHDNK